MAIKKPISIKKKCKPRHKTHETRERKEMEKWVKCIFGKVVLKVLNHMLKQGESFMALLTEVQANAVLLQQAVAAEQDRQNLKIVALQDAVNVATTTLARVQAELDAILSGNQTPESQIIVDNINTIIVDATTVLNAAAR